MYRLQELLRQENIALRETLARLKRELKEGGISPEASAEGEEGTEEAASSGKLPLSAAENLRLKILQGTDLAILNDFICLIDQRNRGKRIAEATSKGANISINTLRLT